MVFLIIEDDRFFAEELKSIINNYFNNVSIDIYTDITNDIDIDKYDAYFLDLEIGDKSGFDFAKKINDSKVYERPIIFVTSHIELWKESYAYHPFWYIDKASYQEDLKRMFVYLNEKLKNDHAFIDIDYNNIMTRIELKDILYLYKEGNYIHIQTHYNNYKIYMSLKKLLKQITFPELFIKVNSGTIVNKNYIQDYNIKNSEIILKNNETFIISRSCKKGVKELFGKKK